MPAAFGHSRHVENAMTFQATMLIVLRRTQQLSICAVSRCHTVSYGVIRCHTVSYGVVRCHTVSYGVTACTTENSVIRASDSDSESYLAMISGVITSWAILRGTQCVYRCVILTYVDITKECAATRLNEAQRLRCNPLRESVRRHTTSRERRKRSTWFSTGFILFWINVNRVSQFSLVYTYLYYIGIVMYS